MKKYFAVGGVMTAIIVLGAVLYSQFYITIWGFHMPKSELYSAIIYTPERSYIITDHESVLQLARELSTMPKLEQIQPNNFGNKEQPAKYRKLLIQTKDHTTYGGSFWKNDNTIIQDSNGYYWAANNTLFQTMDKSLQKAKVID